MLQSVSIVNFEHVIAGWAIICSADYTVVNSSISLVNMSHTFIDMIRLLYLKLCLKKKNFMAPFYGWGSTASRLQRHFEETVYFLPPSS